jgi:hypothetical protein
MHCVEDVSKKVVRNVATFAAWPRINMQALCSLLLAACLAVSIGSSGRAQIAEKLPDDQGLNGTKIVTSLQLRFDERGKPLEMDKQNVTWYVMETDGPGVPVKAPFYGDCADGEPPFVYRPWMPPPATSGSANDIEPGYCLQKSKTLIFVLLFDRPISFGKIRLLAKGMKLPDWDGKLLSKQLAVISIRAGLKNADLEISLVN